MPLVHLAVVVFSLTFQDAQPRADCKEWQECRQLALEAAERQDYERFHDLAWRTMQTGPKNDPPIMYMLARAQSLSGRPGDALVMLQRLAQMGNKNDAATNDDFRRVRALPGWAEFASALDGGATAQPSNAAAHPAVTPAQPASATAQSSTAPTPSTAAGQSPRRDVASRVKPPVSAENSANVAPRSAEPRAAPPGTAPAESLRFTASAATPAGIAYDGVSRRFIVGDRNGRKLTVVDEFSQHVANLASAQSAGFGNIAALEIDPRQGNLWVVSSNPGSGDSASVAQTTLHKLQLISGRVLQSFALADRFGAARFTDVAVTADSTVLVLDDAGQRIFRLRPKAAELELAASLKERPSTIAPAADGLVYIATEDGIVAVDLASKAATPLKAAKGVDLAHISRLRWHKGALVGIQHSDGSYRAIRTTLDSTGRRATRQQVLDPSLATTDPTAATIAAGVLYYLTSGDGAELVIRKIALP
jgi:hypothetical protein